MMVIGVDPHKSTHTATAVDPQTNQPVASVRIQATLSDYRRMLTWARQFEQRRWAVENAEGLGRHLSSWLLSRGEQVVDVPSTATARVRQLSRVGVRPHVLVRVRPHVLVFGLGIMAWVHLWGPVRGGL
jgi:hypothetical protein